MCEWRVFPAVQVLSPSLEALLQHPDWEQWREDLNRIQFRPDEYEAFMQAHRDWKLRSEELRLAREARDEEASVETVDGPKIDA